MTAELRPNVSVIVCAYTTERLKDTYEAIESVLGQTFTPHEVIIAVDHNKELHETLRVQVPKMNSSVPIRLALNEGAQGLSETRNVGIRASSGNIVSFIDDDAIAERDWLENLIKPFQPQQETHLSQATQGTVVAVGGQAIPIWLDGKRPSWFPEELDWIIGCTYKGLPVDGNEIRNVLGCNMAFRKDVFQEAGFFRSETGRTGTTTGCGEEADLCLRITHVMPGAHIVYEEKAVIGHKVTARRTTWRYLWQRSYNEGLYKGRVQRLHQRDRRTRETLSTEGSYLRYLLCKAIPERLALFYRQEDLTQVGSIMISIAAVATGYLVGWVRGWARGSDANGQSESMDSGFGTQQGKVPNQRYEGEG